MTFKTGEIKYRAQEIRLSDKALVYMTSVRQEHTYLFFKRSLDLSFSLLVTIGLLSWLVPLLAILVKTDSRGPAFFLQKRIGKGGRIFTCLKLRSMVVNRHADEQAASENDERITRIGRFLRKSHLDELPQFLNVLSGAMSLVGPRPYMPADDTRFSGVVPDHHLRNLVKPGITGLAQVKGFHGPIPDLQTISHRWQWDAYYVSNASVGMDLRILHQTILLFLTQKTAACK